MQRSGGSQTVTAGMHNRRDHVFFYAWRYNRFRVVLPRYKPALLRTGATNPNPKRPLARKKVCEDRQGRQPPFLLALEIPPPPHATGINVIDDGAIAASKRKQNRHTDSHR